MADHVTPRRHAPKGALKARGVDRVDLMEPADLMEPRCTATSKQSGVRCKRRPIPGGTVCVMHGGKAPQVQAAAKARLEQLVHPAITRLRQLVDQTEFPSTALSAVKDVLDRNGVRAPEAVPDRDATIQKLVILIQPPPPNHGY